jgi:hypothetical protein
LGETVPPDYFPIETIHQSVGEIVNHYVSFTVCRLDKRSGKRGHPGQKKLSLAAQQMFEREREYKRKQNVNNDAFQEGKPAPFSDLPDSLEEGFSLVYTGLFKSAPL